MLPELQLKNKKKKRKKPKSKGRNHGRPHLTSTQFSSLPSPEVVALGIVAPPLPTTCNVSKASSQRPPVLLSRSGSITTAQSTSSTFQTGGTTENSKPHSSLERTVSAASVPPKSPRDEPQPQRLKGKIYRRFYEVLVLIDALDPVRGSHIRREQIDSEDSNSHIELQRSFLRSLATICDNERGGDTVTACALQGSPDTIVIWLAANRTIKEPTRAFIKSILYLSKSATSGNVPDLAEQMTDRIVNFSEPRLLSYQNFLDMNLRQGIACLSGAIKESAVPQEVPAMKTLFRKLQTLQAQYFSEKQQGTLRGLVQECYKIRKYLDIDCMSRYSRAEGTDRYKYILETRHYIGRLGYYCRLANPLIQVAIEVPRILENIVVRFCPSPNSAKSPLVAGNISLEGIADRMSFDSHLHRAEYLDRLNTLNRISDIASRIKESCKFSTRVHSEIILANHFRSGEFDYFRGDKYIGCSKPACFCCYHYMSALCHDVTLDGSHNKVYVRWQPLEPEGDQRKKKALDYLVQKIRSECIGFVNDRKRTGIHHDTRTGTFSMVDEAEKETWTGDADSQTDQSYQNGCQTHAPPLDFESLHATSDAEFDIAPNDGGEPFSDFEPCLPHDQSDWDESDSGEDEGGVSLRGV